MNRMTLDDLTYNLFLTKTIAEYIRKGHDLRSARALAELDMLNDFRSHSQEDQLDHAESKSGDPFR